MTSRGDNGRRSRRRIAAIGVAVIAVAAIAVGVRLSNQSAAPQGPLPVQLATTPQSYLGVYADGTPASYGGATAFTNATGARQDLGMYYSGWYMPFPVQFASTVADDGAVPLVQMDPDSEGSKGNKAVSIAGIASGRYDGYLSAYAETVRSYRHPVIISFGHEMNGWWSSWGYPHIRPATLVAAWGHIVTLFRGLGAGNVTWLWTVNVINDARGGNIPFPTRWWPGSSYATWVAPAPSTGSDHDRL